MILWPMFDGVAAIHTSWDWYVLGGILIVAGLLKWTRKPDTPVNSR